MEDLGKGASTPDADEAESRRKRDLRAYQPEQQVSDADAQRRVEERVREVPEAIRRQNEYDGPADGARTRRG